MRRFLGDDEIQTVEGVSYYNAPTSSLDQAREAVEGAEWAISGQNANAWSDKDQTARASLNLFWQIKGTSYGEDPTGFDALDVRAHKTWAAIAELAAVADNPPAQDKYRVEAQKAYAGAIAAAQRIGQSTAVLSANAAKSAQFFLEAKASGVNDSLKAAVIGRVDELVNTANNILGIPAWAWGLGAVGLLYLLYGRR